MLGKRKVVILTGAGISADSGLKTFRASDGLWESHRVEDVASPEGWERDRQLVLDFYNQRRRDVRAAKPNAAHFACAKLEEKFDVVVVTQNIDDLHERAGSKNIIHLHGEIFKARSSVDPALIYPVEGDISLGDKCAKGSQLRPHIVWFGEAVPMMEDAAMEVRTADHFLVVGTSLRVYPAASLIDFVAPGVPISIVDPEAVYASGSSRIDFRQGKAAVMLPSLVEELLQQG